MRLACLCADGLGIPKHALRIDLPLQRQQACIQRISVVQLVRGGRIVARIHVIQVRAEPRLRLRTNHGIVDALHKVDGLRAVPVVLQHPQAIAVAVRREVGILGVDGGPGPAVQVGDDVELSGARRLDVCVERIECGGREARRFGHRERFGEEILVLGVVCQGLLDGALAADEDKVVVPSVGLDGDGPWGGHIATELRENFGVEF